MTFRLYFCALVLFSINSIAHASVNKLEEVIVTAQKRPQSLQSVPIAISTLTNSELKTLGITSLSSLIDSVIPSLRINPNGNAQSTLTVAIRGDGQSDVSQTTKQSPVAIYIDGIYLGRAQGLAMEMADLERIEVLRGPQGTLFGRNSTSGAISITTQKPTGKFNIEQTLSIGNYNAHRSVTRINLTQWANVRTKIDYIHSERDGWVKNKGTGSDFADFNAYHNNAGSFSLNWQALDNLDIDYTYDASKIDNANLYFQIQQNFTGPIAAEGNRKKSTRFPIPLTPIKTDTKGHSIITDLTLTDTIALKSLTAYRQLDEDGSNNLGGVFGFSGLIVDEDIEQEQYSQEFQLLGDHSILEWVAGAFYIKETVDFDLELLISLDPSFNAITPPIAIAAITSVVSEAESIAAFGQTTVAITQNLQAIIGTRYTKDNKSARRGSFFSPNVNSEHLDYTLAINYDLRQHIFSYLKWSTAYKAGGYNARSHSFLPYDKETNQTWEAGIKSDFLNRQVKLNMAAFHSKFNDKQIDFIDPANTLNLETLNAKENVDISGFEMELTALIHTNWRLGLHYTYLDGDMPLQPHPTVPGEMQAFELIQTPEHSGSLLIDYRIQSPIGLINTHINISSTSSYAYSTVPNSRRDSYSLINGRVTLNNIPIINNKNLSVSAWGKNLSDEQYATLGFSVGAPIASIIQSFGTPRTLGIDITYLF